jgi:hypothetical protein
MHSEALMVKVCIREISLEKAIFVEFGIATSYRKSVFE